MSTFIFTVFAKKRFIKLDTAVQHRITLKLKELKKQGAVGAVLKPLHNFEPATHRLRIGDYRLILRRENPETFIILDVGHRSSVYQ